MLPFYTFICEANSQDLLGGVFQGDTNVLNVPTRIYFFKYSKVKCELGFRLSALTQQKKWQLNLTQPQPQQTANFIKGYLGHLSQPKILLKFCCCRIFTGLILLPFKGSRIFENNILILLKGSRMFLKIQYSFKNFLFFWTIH